MQRTRRALLTGLATGTALLAGCTGGDSATTTDGSTTLPTRTAGGSTTTATTPATASGPTTAASEPTTAADGSTTASGRTTADSGYSPPAYAGRSAFTERTLSLRATDGCSLGATLSVPEGEGSVPGVVLVHGSGPQNRNEAVGPLKPFQDLAWGLASRGVAVLRYDKRSFACALDPTEVTIDDVTVEDAVTAVERLREHERVAADDVVVVGHSLGGAMAPRIARRDGNLAGIALLAANARPLPDLVFEQTKFSLRLDGELDERDQQRLQQVEAAVERLKAANIPEDQVILGGGKPFWQSLADYDQLSVAESLSLPVFVAHGARDRQVPIERDFELWTSTLADDRMTAHRYEKATHFFTTAPVPGPLWNEPARPDNVLETLVVDLASWCARVTGTRS